MSIDLQFVHPRPIYLYSQVLGAQTVNWFAIRPQAFTG